MLDLSISLSAGQTSYTWDAVNRLTHLSTGAQQTSYAYRADGMRVGRWEGDGNETLWRYDGQMPVQEVRTTETGGTTVIDSALGARGVEAYSKRTASGTTIGYPLYDAHGNNVATLTKAGSVWSIEDTLRAYDAWGNVAGALGDPSGRYCANLGHVQDDESGLVYMRARYYEPGTGRFISEDPARDGLNWFAYCDGDPVNLRDPSGENAIGWALGTFFLFMISWAPQSASASTLLNGAKFLEAVVFALATGGLNSTAVSDWTAKAANDVVASMITTNGADPRKISQGARFMLNTSAVVGFYTGYALFLAFAMAELDQWVMGNVQ